MKVSGFTFVRNAVKYDYPIIEAITSILPICDEFIVAIGDSEDNTDELIKSIQSPKIKIINTIWDKTLRKGGVVLAKETDKAFNQISNDSDWAFYIQADEIVHEKHLPIIKDSMIKWKNDDKVEGLLFNYIHFYGSYDYIGDSRRWYRKEIRIIRNDKTYHSFRDAQGFRKNNCLLRVKPIDAYIYHYGWVKHPAFQQAKQQYFHKLWHDDEWMEKHISKDKEFDYSQIDSLKYFKGTHPEVIKERIKNRNWQFSFDPTKKNFPLKSKILHFTEKCTGWRIGEYKNYRII